MPASQLINSCANDAIRRFRFSPPKPARRDPGQFDATHYFHRMLINDNNINVGRACQECTRTIRWHNDAGGALSDSDSLDGFPRGSIDKGEI